MKKKEILMSVLALNMVSGAYLNAVPSVSGEKIYERMVKNLETGKSNKDNYELLEAVLKQKNKELKDLYTQGNYVMKPEYLEWQIFISGFYHNSHKGDNTSHNAKFSSNPSSSTNGKTFSREQEAKTVDLGIVIPMKGISKEPLGVNVIPKVVNIPHNKYTDNQH